MQGLLTWRNLFRLIMLAVAAFVIWSTLTVQGRTATKAALFLPSLIPGSPIRPIDAFTDKPSKEPITFSLDGTSWEGDLYLPGTKGPHPGIILALGVNPLALDDDRVIRLGEGLARMGVATLLPVSQNLVDKTVTLQEVDFMVGAFRFLAGRPEVDPGRVGFVGVCVGSTLALLAAQDERIVDQVNFVNWFGGYYRLDELIVSVATHGYELDGEHVAWRPDHLTDEVVRLRTIEFVEDAEERELLRRGLVRNAPLSADEKGGLSATGALVHDLYSTRDPVEARAILDRLPAEVQDLMRRLSPATNVDRTRARVYVMDDTGDRLIPYAHSRALTDDLDDELMRHTEFTIFSHVDLDQLPNPLHSIPELWALYRHVNAIFGSIL